MEQFIEKLTTQLKERLTITINGSQKQVVGMAHYATINSLNAEYIKVAFSDGSGIYYPLDEAVVFYFDRKLGTADGITDDMIGESEPITWRGKVFFPSNVNDYQFVQELLVGSIHDIEGEVRFSDYESEDGSVLSLGLNMFEGKRDDVYARPVELSNITF